MNAKQHPAPAIHALVTLAAIKAAIEGFDDGETNLFDTLDAITMAIEAFRAGADAPGRREAA